MIRHIKKLIRRMINNAVSDIHTSMPAQVVSYDAATNLASIQPCINIIRSNDPDNDIIQMPLLEDIPVKQFGSGKCLLTIAPQAGSYGVFHISERSIENWIVEGGIVNPSSIQRFDISDGFFDPGVYPIMADENNGLIAPPINTDRIEMRTRTGVGFISVVDNDTVEINGSDDSAVAYTDLKTAFDQLKSDYDNFVSAYTLHLHVCAAPAANSGPPVYVPPLIPPVTIPASSSADMTAAEVATVKLP